MEWFESPQDRARPLARSIDPTQKQLCFRSIRPASADPSPGLGRSQIRTRVGFTQVNFGAALCTHMQST